MKTTFKQFNEGLLKAKTLEQFVASIQDGKFKLDAKDLFVENYSLSIADKNLTSLIGCPETVDGDFKCDYNELTSLKGGPKTVAGHYICNKNKISSFDGIASHINGNLYMRLNNLHSLKDIEKHIKRIAGTAHFSENFIKSHLLGLLKIEGLQRVGFGSSPQPFREVERIINKYLPEGDIFACQQELIDGGFDEFAKL